MVYMTVEEQSFTLLHLKRSPGIRSWSLLVGKCVCAKVHTFYILTYKINLLHWGISPVHSIRSNSVIKSPSSLILIAGIASIGLAAAYYSSGTQTEMTQSVCQFATFDWRNFPHLPTATRAAFPSFHFMCCVDHADSVLWKLFYVTGCLFVAMQNMEEWEEAVFDKTKNLIELKSFSLYAVVLTFWRKGQEKGQ